MKKLQNRKLTLRAEHIRTLADRELLQIGGGLKITDASNASQCVGQCGGFTVGACSDVSAANCQN
jgi:hypothetical protein